MLDEEVSVHPEYFPVKQFEDAIERSKQKISVARDDKGKNKTAIDLTTIEIDIEIIDKVANKTRRPIYEVTHETYFKEVTLFIDKFL